MCDIDSPAALWPTLDLQFDPDWRLKFKLYEIFAQQKGSHLTLFSFLDPAGSHSSIF